MFEFTCKYDNTSQKYPSVIFQLDDDSNLDDMCRAFEQFLKACGYNFSGSVEIISDDCDETDNWTDGEKTYE